jgi:hypothetical protein
MGKKMWWFKTASDAYLASPSVRELSWAARGVYNTMLCVLRTQVDRPGYFVKHSKPLDLSGIRHLLNTYSPPKEHSTNRPGTVVQHSLNSILNSGLITQDEYGTYYSPEIVKDIEESERKREAGQASWAKSVQQGAQQAVDVEKNRIEKEKKTSLLNRNNADGAPGLGGPGASGGNGGLPNDEEQAQILRLCRNVAKSVSVGAKEAAEGKREALGDLKSSNTRKHGSPNDSADP